MYLNIHLKKHPSIKALKRGRGWTFEVAGECQFQQNLSRIVRVKTNNGHDEKFIAKLINQSNDQVLVDINDKPVAFLRDADSAVYCRAISDTTCDCHAKICKG